MPKLLSRGEGMPPDPVKPRFAKGTVAFQSMSWHEESFVEWADASLFSVVRYLRGSKYLELPSEWRCCFPVALALPG